MTRIFGISLFVSFLAGAFLAWLAAGPRSDDRPRGRTPAPAVQLARTGTLEPDPVPGERQTSDAAPVSAEFLRRLRAGDLDSAGLESLLEQWARSDPAGFLDELPALDLDGAPPSPDADGPVYIGALRLATEADPGYALTLGERQAGALGLSIRSIALEALAAEDPDAALDYLSGLPIGEVRDRLLGSVARGFARADIDAAVAWLSTLPETDGAAFYPVIHALAFVDLPRAIELDMRAIELDYGGPDYGSIVWLRRGLEANRQNPARIADTFASLQSTGLLADTLAWWALGDPYGAIAWVQSRETISSWVIARMAGELASRDYQSAMALAQQFSPAVRAA